MEDVFREIQVLHTREKALYRLFFGHHGDFYEDQELQLFLGVFGLSNPRSYERDPDDLVPGWGICTFDGAEHSVDGGTVMYVRFEDEFPKGVIMRFVWREGKQSPAVEQFVMKLIEKIEQVAEVEVIYPKREPAESLAGAELNQQSTDSPEINAGNAETVHTTLSQKEIEERVSDRQSMRKLYKDYSTETAKRILIAIQEAWATYEQQGERWGPAVIGKSAAVNSTTAGRYLKAFYKSGITEIQSRGETIIIPYKSRQARSG